MGSILIAMPKPGDANRIVEIIRDHGMQFDMEYCTAGSEVLQIANDRDYGVVICTKRLRDMDYSELIEYLPHSFSMIILTNDASLESFSHRCVKLLLPFKRSELTSTIEMLVADYYRPVRRKKTAPRRERTEEEKRTIERAKYLLMERNGMTEPEAFRYIQKNSMDCGRSAVDTAQMILLINGDE